MAFIARKAQIDLAIIRAMETPLSNVARCGRFSIPAGSYINMLKGRGLWPMAEQSQMKSISTIFEQISNMPELGNMSCGNPCMTCPKFSLGTTLRKEVENIISVKRGLCLDCVKAHRDSSLGSECRLCVPKL